MLIKDYRFLLNTVFVLSLFLLMDGVGYGQEKKDGTDYNSLLAKADTYYSKGDYVNAKLYYQYAGRMKPTEEYPKERMAKTVSKLHEKLKLVDQYTAIITEADKLATEKEFDKAIAKYREASKIIPSEGYPDAKIAEINGSINYEENKKFAYDDALYRAEKFLKYDKFEQAIEQYQKAQELFPNDTFPASQIEKLTLQLADLIEARKGYGEILANADRLFQLKYYKDAREAYVKAAAVKPDEAYITAKIKVIDDLLVKKTEYDQKIEQADAFYMDKKLDESKGAYQSALSLYPSEKYPQDMIDKINTALMSLKSKDELFSDAIAQADTFLVHNDYTNALKEYENASNIRSSAKYPKEKIAEITAMLDKQAQNEQEYELSIKRGDQYLSVKKWANARIEYQAAVKLKPNELYATEKLAQVDKGEEAEAAILESYKTSMSKADKFLAENKFEEANTEYKNALIILPGDETATAQLEEVKRRKKQEEQNLTEYGKLIANGDNFMNKEKYQEAIDAYTQARNLDDSDSYTSLQITLATQKLKQKNEAENAYNKAIASADIFYRNKEYNRAYEFYEQAAKLKPGAKYPAEKMTAIASVQNVEKKSNEDSYEAAIKKADGLFKVADYKEAKLAYLKASGLKPAESYPKSKITEIEKLIKVQEALDASYNKTIGIADRFMENGEFEKAKINYTQALSLKPAEAYPAEQLSKIEKGILKNELNVQDSYNDLITKADKSAEAKDYDDAISNYQQALKLKANEPYPTEKIKEMELLKDDLKQAQDNYNRLIVEADRQFTSRSFEEAKKTYIEASALFPNEEHPKNRIDEINLSFKAQNQEKQASYDKAIADADKLYTNGSLIEALSSYQMASALMPDESYPQEMIANIRISLDNMAARELLNSKITVQNNENEKLNFEQLDISDRKNSTLLIRARGLGIRDFKVFVSYGKGNSKKGGFVMPVKPGDDMNEFVFKIGEQYAWFTEDNNYITLTPQGGSIEIEAVKIIKEK